MSIMVILNFAVDDDDYIYIFSVQQFTVTKTIQFYRRVSFFMDMLCVFYMLY